MNNKLIQIAQRILLEASSSNTETKIEKNGTTPDKLEFNGKDYEWNTAYAAFCFLGKEPGVFTYIKNKDSIDKPTHPFIFASFSEAYYKDHDPIKIGSFLKRRHIITSKVLTAEDVRYTIDVQQLANADELDESSDYSDYSGSNDYDYSGSNAGEELMMEVRNDTYAGRVWRDIKHDDDYVDIISFWCEERDIKLSRIETIKKALGLTRTIYWVGLNSKFFKEYSGKAKDVADIDDKIKLKSILYTTMTHDEIKKALNIALVKRHTNKSELTNKEKNLLWEFGYDKTIDKDLKNRILKNDPADKSLRALVIKKSEDDDELEKLITKKTLGGFDTIARKNAETKQEDVESYE